MQEMVDFCAAHGINARMRRGGWLWATINKVQDGAWQSLLDELNRQLLHPFEEWTPDQVAARTGSDQHISGVFETTAATVQPALLARGLHRVALEKGFRFYENTPMRQLKR